MSIVNQGQTFLKSQERFVQEERAETKATERKKRHRQSPNKDDLVDHVDHEAACQLNTYGSFAERTLEQSKSNAKHLEIKKSDM